MRRDAHPRQAARFPAARVALDDAGPVDLLAIGPAPTPSLSPQPDPPDPSPCPTHRKGHLTASDTDTEDAEETDSNEADPAEEAGPDEVERALVTLLLDIISIMDLLVMIRLEMIMVFFV